MPRPFLIVSQSDYLIQIVDINSHTEIQRMTNSADPDQLASSDPHCLQRQGISGFGRTRVKSQVKVKLCPKNLHDKYCVTEACLTQYTITTLCM